MSRSELLIGWIAVWVCSSCVMRHTPHHTFAPGVIFLTLRRSQWQQTIIPENYADQFGAGNYCPLSITLLTKAENLGVSFFLTVEKRENTFRCIAPRRPTGIGPWDSVFWVRTQSRRGSYRTGGLMVCVNFYSCEDDTETSLCIHEICFCRKLLLGTYLPTGTNLSDAPPLWPIFARQAASVAAVRLSDILMGP